MKPENAREQLEKMIKDQSIVRVSHLRPIAKNLISYIKIIENDNDHLRGRIAEQNGLIKRQRNALARLNDQVAQMKDENELYREALETHSDTYLIAKKIKSETGMIGPNDLIQWVVKNAQETLEGIE